MGKVKQNDVVSKEINPAIEAIEMCIGREKQFIELYTASLTEHRTKVDIFTNNILTSQGNIDKLKEALEILRKEKL